MFKTCTTEVIKPLLSSRALNGWIIGKPSHFHTSSILAAETPRKRAARLIRKRKQENQAEKERIRKATAPHFVLGTRPGEDAKWQNCDLAKCLITPEMINASPMPVVDAETGKMKLPQYFNYGIDGAGDQSVRKDNLKLLFEALPIAAAMPEEEASLSFVTQQAEQHMKNYQKIELPKVDMFARVVDLRNSNAEGIASENRRRVIATFSTPSNPFDTGRTEVQVALLTMKIRNLWDHLSRSRKDHSNKRTLQELVHQRAKLLKYLKRVDRDRYDILLERVALEPESVEGELTISLQTRI